MYTLFYKQVVCKKGFKMVKSLTCLYWFNHVVLNFNAKAKDIFHWQEQKEDEKEFWILTWSMDIWRPKIRPQRQLSIVSLQIHHYMLQSSFHVGYEDSKFEFLIFPTLLFWVFLLPCFIHSASVGWKFHMMISYLFLITFLTNGIQLL